MKLCGPEAGNGDSRRAASTAIDDMHRSPPADSLHAAWVRREAAATQRSQQVALETVVNETVDDRIHATVAATT